MVVTMKSFAALLMLTAHVTGLSMSSSQPPAKAAILPISKNAPLPSGRRAFVSKSITSLPLIITGVSTLTTIQTANAATSTEGYNEGPRGLKYKVIQPPTDPSSPSPQRAQKVKAKYTLWLNGFPDDTPSAKKVDSSKGVFGEKPFEFIAGVYQVINGWDLTILDMKVGEERRIIVPSDLGYGEKGAGGAIPGGSTLYFDLELVEIGEISKLGPEQVKWLEDNPL